jgi:hypothetical protein
MNDECWVAGLSAEWALHDRCCAHARQPGSADRGAAHSLGVDTAGQVQLLQARGCLPDHTQLHQTLDSKLTRDANSRSPSGGAR